MHRVLAGLVLTCGSLGGAATAVASEPPPTDELTLPDGIDIGVEFPRYLMVERRLEAIVDNQSDVDITVIDVALRSPLFEPVEPNVHDYTVHAGWRQDLKMDVGASICPPADGPSMMEMTVEIEGEQQHGLVEIDISPIAKINTRECGERFVLERSNVEFGPDFEVNDDVMTTTVTLTRREGDDPISITGVRGSVLFIVDPDASIADADVLGSMASSAPTGAAPITIRVGRCSPHAVADAKKPYQFAVWVVVGDSEPYYMELAPEGELREALAQMLQDCIASGADTG